MTNEIKDLLLSLIVNSDVVIGAPSTIEKMQNALPSIEVKEYTIEESLDLLFERRKRKALEIASKLPSPPEFAAPAIDALYNEIRECILFGLNGAAITLSGILVEFTLKYVTFKIEMGSASKYDAGVWDEFEKIDFAGAIARASKIGILTKQNKKQLNDFRDRCRNPYSHYNIKKITNNCYFKNVSIFNFKTRKVDVQDLATKDSLVFQAQAKPLVDAQKVFDIFGFADSAVRVLLFQAYSLLENNVDKTDLT